MKALRKFSPLILLSMSLAACQVTGPADNGGGSAMRPVQSGVDGSWVDANGIVSNFNGGIFQTVTTDTNEKLAEGNYRYLNPRLVEIDLRSLVRGTVSKVNCALVSSSQLNCTTSNGAQFSLYRRG